MRATSHLIGLAGVLVLMAAGCGTGDDSLDAVNTATEETAESEEESTSTNEQDMPMTEDADDADGPVTALVSGEFVVCDGSEDHIEGATYDETAVPEGTEFTVTVTETPDGGSRFELSVTGAEPDRDFGAHLHTDPCGPDPADAGPHYQDEIDPAATPDEPSADPDFANADNEVWLDFSTDDSGAGEAETTVDWRVRPGEANAIVLHERHTSTTEGDAGMAGERLACANLSL